MSKTTAPRSIAVLGIGIIGAAVARNLVRKGFAVRVWNRTPEKALVLAADGVEVFHNPADALRGADILVTALKDGEAVEEAVTAALPGLRKDTVWLQLSTVGLVATEALSKFAERNGIVFYDAPILGTRQPAEQGKLIVLASGPESSREIARSVFDAIGQRTLWVSDKPGASSRLKLALNAYVFALTHGVAETLAIARALGVDPALVVDAITGGPLDSAYFQTKSAAILNGDYAPSFTVDNGLKDTLLVIDALAGTGVIADIAAAGRNRFQRATKAGHGGDDIAASFLADAG